MRGANAVVRPLNRPRLDEQQTVVGRIDIGPLKRLNRPRPNGLQTVVVQGSVEVVCITVSNYHVERRAIVARSHQIFYYVSIHCR